MTRTKIKGTRFKAASSPDSEPDFYAMPPVAYVTPHHSSDEEMSNTSEQHTPAEPRAAAPSESFEPLPIEYATFPQAVCSAPVSSYLLAGATQEAPSYTRSEECLPPPPPPASIASMSASELAEADRILDEAVNELFQDEGGDNFADFVNDWNPSGQAAFGMALEDDAKLGFMLEKLLED
jgi:hypothetical protein